MRAGSVGRPSELSQVASTRASTLEPAIAKQGQLLLFDADRGRFMKVFCVLNGAASPALYIFSSASRTAHEVRPHIVLPRCRRVFAHMEDSDALPTPHKLHLGLEADDGVVLLRATDERTAQGWAAALQGARGQQQLHPVAAMASLRGCFSPQLFMQLFPQELFPALPAAGSPRSPPVPRTLLEARRGRFASASALPVRERRVHRPVPATYADPALLGHAPSATVAERCDAAVQCLVAVDETDAALSAQGAVHHAEVGGLRAEVDALHVAQAELQRQVADARAQADAASRRALDLELDSANAASRVLELEQEARLLRDGNAELRRRYQSLEGQLQVQEEGFAARLEEEKASLMEALQRDVKAHWEQSAERQRGREQEYEDRVKDLRAQVLDLTTELAQAHLGAGTDSAISSDDGAP